MNPLEQLVAAFARLPGVGEKTATRFALFLLRDEKGIGQALAAALSLIKEKMYFCKECQNLTQNELCIICADSGRNHAVICVVETLPDLIALEKTGDYRGLYHVLHGSISPLDGIGPDELRVQAILKRLLGGVKEVILATNHNATGEMTALYLKKMLASSGVRISRIASGIPVGGNVEYTDSQTLTRAMESRRDF